MAGTRKLSAFSQYRLDGEPVPDDVKLLLAHHDEFSERTGLELNWKKKWAPWLDTSYLSTEERKNPDITANIQATAEVCGMVAFICAEDDGNYFGYWRGPKKRAIAKSPLVCLDNEGQFRLRAGATFAEAILVEKAYGDEERFAEFRDWLRSIGIQISWETLEDVTYSEEKVEPNELRNQGYYRLLGKKPPR